MVIPNGMIELLAKTFATDEILLITTTRHDMRELRSYRHSIRGPRSYCPLEVGNGSLLGVRI